MKIIGALIENQVTPAGVPLLTPFSVEPGAGYGFGGVSTSVEASENGSTPAGAWGAAEAAAGTPATPVIADAGNLGNYPQLIMSSLASMTGSSGSYNATYQASSALIAFASFTCYFRIWLQAVTTTLSGGTITVSNGTPYDLVLTPASSAGYCVPDPATFSEDDVTTYNSSLDVGTLTPSQPPAQVGDLESSVTVNLYLVAFSCLEGYVPPLDGSASGFPLY
jgi:hypothetical protein